MGLRLIRIGISICESGSKSAGRLCARRAAAQKGMRNSSKKLRMGMRWKFWYEERTKQPKLHAGFEREQNVAAICAFVQSKTQLVQDTG